MAEPNSEQDLGERNQGAPPQVLGDLATPLRMTRTAWLIAAMLFVAVAAFFVIVVLLGVDTS